jgi:membrane-bound transcription factor site-1 protease
LFFCCAVLSQDRLNSKNYNENSYTTKSPLCGISVSSNSSCHDTREIKITFSSSIVENEYIVKFKNYYKAYVRRHYIETALNSSGIKDWSIIPRNNAASRYPSDFDVIQLTEKDKYQGLKALNDHPSIKSITPQKFIQRTLKFINTTIESDTLQNKNLKRKINHVSL